MNDGGTVSGYQAIDWMGMHVLIPPDWEITRHSVRSETGSMVFVDRRHQRLQVGWTRCETRPDAGQIFRDFRSRDREGDPQCDLGPLYRVSRWNAYRRTTAGKATTRAGMYDRKNLRWIDAVLVWPEALDETVEKNVLASFDTADAEADRKSWRAFRLDVESPADWRLAHADVKPADVTLTFARGDDQFVVRRIGMPDIWFDGNLGDFLRKHVRTARGNFGIAMQGRHEGASFSGTERMFHPRWLWSGRTRRHDRAWLCPSAHALYHVSAISHRSKPVPVEDFAIHCCPR